MIRSESPMDQLNPDRLTRPRVRFFNTYEPVTSFYRDLLPHLVSSGFNCDVVISRASYRSERTSLDHSGNDGSINYHRMPALFAEAADGFAKLTSALLYVVFASTTSLLGKGVDMNFFLTQPPLFSAWGMILKLLRGQKYVCLLMDIYPDVAIEAGMLRRRGLIARTTSFLSRMTWRHADQVIVIGRCMANRVEAAGVPPERISRIHNWGDESSIIPIPAESNSMRKENGFGDRFVVLYSGNMGVSHTFDEILQVAIELRSDDGIAFVFTGRGSRKKEIEKAIQQHQLTNVTLLPFQPPDRLAESLSMADVHLVTLRTGFEGLVVPSKTYGALASGRPVIYVGDRDGEISQMLCEQRVGVTVSAGDAAGLKEAIMAYRNDPARRKKEGNCAREISMTVLDKNSAIMAYAELLKLVSGRGTL